MIPSTGATTNIPLPTTTSNVASVSSLVKPQSMPTTIKPTVVDVLRGSNVARQAASAGERRIEAQKQAAVATAPPRIFMGLTEQVGNQPSRRKPKVAPEPELKK
jgi:hypothetical protein